MTLPPWIGMGPTGIIGCPARPAPFGARRNPTADEAYRVGGCDSRGGTASRLYRTVSHLFLLLGRFRGIHWSLCADPFGMTGRGRVEGCAMRGIDLAVTAAALPEAWSSRRLPSARVDRHVRSRALR
ncbi:hypothetical protein GCM10020227_27140 [Streptomyces flavovirens]